MKQRLIIALLCYLFVQPTLTAGKCQKHNLVNDYLSVDNAMALWVRDANIQLFDCPDGNRQVRYERQVPLGKRVFRLVGADARARNTGWLPLAVINPDWKIIDVVWTKPTYLMERAEPLSSSSNSYLKAVMTARSSGQYYVTVRNVPYYKRQPFLQLPIGSIYYVYDLFPSKEKHRYALIGNSSRLTPLENDIEKGLIGWVRTNEVDFWKSNQALEFRFRRVSGRLEPVRGAAVFDSAKAAVTATRSFNDTGLISLPPKKPKEYAQMRYPVFKSSRDAMMIGFPVIIKNTGDTVQFLDRYSEQHRYAGIGGALDIGSMELTRPFRMKVSDTFAQKRRQTRPIAYIRGWVAKKNDRNERQVSIMALTTQGQLIRLLATLKKLHSEKLTLQKLEAIWNQLLAVSESAPLGNDPSFQGFLKPYGLNELKEQFIANKHAFRDFLCEMKKQQNALQALLEEQRLRIKIRTVSPQCQISRTHLGDRKIWFHAGHSDNKMAWIYRDELP